MVNKSRVNINRPVYEALNDKIDRLKAMKKEPKMAKLAEKSKKRKPAKPTKRVKTSKKVARALPYIKSLINATPTHRPNLLKTYPKYVIDDMIHTINQISLGKYTTNKVKDLRKHKSVLLKLLNKKNKKIIYKQKGGFLGMIASAVLPFIAGAIGRSIAK